MALAAVDLHFDHGRANAPSVLCNRYSSNATRTGTSASPRSSSAGAATGDRARPSPVPHPHSRRTPRNSTASYLLTLHAGDRLSPHALHFYAQALRDGSAAILYSDEDHLAADGSRTEPLFKPGWSPELLCTPPLSRPLRPLSTQRRLQPVPLSLSRASHPANPLSPIYSRTTYATNWFPVCAAPPDARLQPHHLYAREIRQLRECVKAVRKTAAIPIDLLVVHHLESGSPESDSAVEMRRYKEKSGGTWIPYRGAFDFARMNNLAAAKASAPYLLFMNDDVIVRQRGWDSNT